MPQSDQKTLAQKADTVKVILVLLLVCMALIGALTPRFMAYGSGLIAVIGSMILVFFMKEKFVLSRPVFLCVSLIITLAAFSSVWSPDPGFALERSGKIALILLPGALLFSLMLHLKNEHIRPFIWVLPILVGIGALYSINEMLFDMPGHRLLRGMSADENVGMAVTNRGIFCSMILYFCCVPVILNHEKYKRFSKVALGGLTAIVIIMLYLSESQSNQLGFIVGIVALIAFPYRSKIAWPAISGLIIGLIMVAPIIAQLAFQTLAADVSSIAWLKQGYAANRMEIWNFISRYAMQNPLYGYGIEATRLIGEFDTEMLYRKSKTVLHPHNFAIQVWIEFGAFGALLASSFVGYILYQIKRVPVSQAKILLPIFLVFLSVSATGYGMWQGWWLGEYMLLLSMSALVIKMLPRPA